MNTLHFSDNLIKLRHKKKITQEQLADFVGVTKASVSKWETKQSLPDVLLLPQLAAFFDITIDELLGYEPQLSREQIQKIYHDLTAAFAEMPFADAMAQSQDYVKKYYSCYPFLFQICNLWLNHFMLAETPAGQAAVLASISDLCSHIISGCPDIGICEDTTILRATVDLQLGKSEEVIEALKEILDPHRLSAQSDGILIQAYMLAGQKDNADSFTQMSMFLHLLNLVASATQYLNIHSNDLDICEDTILRILQVADTYQLKHLHPNAIALFQYQAAIVYCIHGRKQKALDMITQYISNVEYLLTDNHLAIHGDNYFNLIPEWYEQLAIGADAPRDKRLIFETFIQSLENPAFALLEETEEFQKLKKSLAKRKETLHEFNP